MPLPLVFVWLQKGLKTLTIPAAHGDVTLDNYEAGWWGTYTDELPLASSVVTKTPTVWLGSRYIKDYGLSLSSQP